MRKSGGNGRRRNGNGQFWQLPDWLAEYIRRNEEKWDENRKDWNEHRELLTKTLIAINERATAHNRAILHILKRIDNIEKKLP